MLLVYSRHLLPVSRKPSSLVLSLGLGRRIRVQFGTRKRKKERKRKRKRKKSIFESICYLIYKERAIGVVKRERGVEEGGPCSFKQGQ
jgi:hypothetical protein